MSRNAGGTYSLPLSSVVADTAILASWANTTMADLATEITDSLSRSGKGGLSASIPSDVGCTGTFNPSGAPSAGDNSALGYSGTLGAILTGQGSTNDVTLQNDAGSTVFSIPTGTTRGVFAGKVEPGGDTAASDAAALGYTATEGLILTGQGSTYDVVLKNDADSDVARIPTGTTIFDVPGTLQINTFNEDEDVVGNSGTVDLDLSVATVFSTADLDSQTVTFTFSNPGADGRGSCFTLIMNSAGDATSLSWPAGVDWPGGTEPSWGSGIDIVSFLTVDGGTIWYGFLGGLSFS